YDCQNDQMVYADNVNLVSVEHKDFFPELKEEEYYFGVYFPSKSKTIVGKLDFWKFTTALTLVVALFFGYGLFIMLRQKRLSEIQRDFVSNITHELKTPLSTLSLASNTLLDKVPQEWKKYAAIIQQETSRLQGHVEKILTGSLLEKQLNLKFETVAMHEFLEKIMNRFKQQYLPHMIKWEADFEQMEWRIDVNLLDNILSNIIDNAVKYGAHAVSIQVKRIGKNLSICVKDDGIGMSAEHAKRIFHRFYRIPEVKDQHNAQGFGLGLYIVKQSVKKMNGKISVKSTPGEGSEFKISIPNG
ncbi:MAG: HAMP domain-containing sensor histidine kinase, partial [Bacteroidota bacterium]